MSTSIRKISGVLFLILAFTIVVQPLSSVAYVPSDSNPAEDARNYAARESGSTWFLIGCVGGFIGYIIAVAVEPSPPASAIVGQDEEYVATFNDVYISEVKSLRQRNALYGCLVGTGATIAIYAAVILAADNALE